MGASARSTPSSTAFDRVVAQGTLELVLVSGYSGIGKSSVVHELHKVLVPPRGLFASGKFDQYQRDIPYATLAQAFQSLVRPLLGQSEAELGRWRDALRDALGPNGQLIVNLVPELELVIGKQPPVAELPPQDAKNRFQMVFRRFLGVFARKEHPLALFLDDLQWLDAATLDLLEHLVTHSDVRHLLLVGAYRDNEVSPAHPLIRTLETIRKAGARVQEIVLTPLPLDDVGALVADALHSALQHVRPLAQLVHEKTDGNPFFAIQFFTTLADEGLLTFDSVALAWHWDIERIRAKSYTDNVVDFMAGKLRRFSANTQEALKQLACLGNVAEVTNLALVHGKAEGAIHDGSLGSRPRRDRFPQGERLHVSARPDPAGGVFTDSRRTPCRDPPAHRPCAAGAHDERGAHRSSVRGCKPAQSRRRSAGRPRRESAGGDDRPACRAKGQGIGGLCIGAHVFRCRLDALLYWILKLKARFLSGNYAEALAAADKAMPLLPAAAGQIQLLDYFFYTALTVSALHEDASADGAAGACGSYQPCLERRLVELRVTEGREARGPALHGCDEALLALDDVPRHCRLRLSSRSPARSSDSPHTASSASFRRRRPATDWYRP